MTIAGERDARGPVPLPGASPARFMQRDSGGPGLNFVSVDAELVFTIDADRGVPSRPVCSLHSLA